MSFLEAIGIAFDGDGVYSDPYFAVSDRKLIYKERLNDRHSVTAPVALPECAHVLLAFPLRNRIPRIGIILVSKEPLALQSLRFSTDFKSLFKGSFEGIPLPGKNFAPDYPHVHICYFPVRCIAHCITQCSCLTFAVRYTYSAAFVARGYELAQPGRVAEIERLPAPDRRGGRIRLNAPRTDLHQDLGIIGLGYTDRAAGVACRGRTFGYRAAIGN